MRDWRGRKAGIGIACNTSSLPALLTPDLLACRARVVLGPVFFPPQVPGTGIGLASSKHSGRNLATPRGGVQIGKFTEIFEE